MERAAIALATLSEGLPASCPARVVYDADWLASHPGGFAPTTPIEDENECFAIAPDRIAELGAHLTDEEFDQLLHAIRSWQRDTMMDYLFQLPPDLIATKFCQNHPQHGDVLLEVARRAGIPFLSFLGTSDHTEK